MAAAPSPVGRGRLPHGARPAWVAAAVVVAALAVTAVVVARTDVFRGSSGTDVVEGSGVAATETRDVPPFRGVELTGSNTVTVAVGGTQRVVVHADSNLLDRVTTDVRNGRLLVGTRGSFSTSAPMRVEVTVPSLTALALSGSGVVTASGVGGEALTASLSGSGVLRATGIVDRLDVALGGSGQAQLARLAARDVRAVVSGSGQIVVQATESLDASIPGSGTIVYTGDPSRVTTAVTGSGAITRG